MSYYLCWQVRQVSAGVDAGPAFQGLLPGPRQPLLACAPAHLLLGGGGHGGECRAVRQWGSEAVWEQEENEDSDDSDDDSDGDSNGNDSDNDSDVVSFLPSGVLLPFLSATYFSLLHYFCLSTSFSPFFPLSLSFFF